MARYLQRSSNVGSTLPNKRATRILLDPTSPSPLCLVPPLFSSFSAMAALADWLWLSPTPFFQWDQNCKEKTFQGLIL